MIFKKQKIYCNNCGILFVGEPVGSAFTKSINCSSECRKEFELKYTYYVMGKDYENRETNEII